jgi:hypothetical protein
MRRLLTGYAMWFNKRHGRVGHLFQNRYKSTVVDSDQYLCALVRYIHSNPLATGLVKNPSALEDYAWFGHAGLMGQAARGFQQVEEVLGRFGNSCEQARATTVRRRVATYYRLSHDDKTGSQCSGNRKTLGAVDCGDSKGRSPRTTARRKNEGGSAFFAGVGLV